MQKAFGKKSVIFMFLFPAFLIYTALLLCPLYGQAITAFLTGVV